MAQRQVRHRKHSSTAKATLALLLSGLLAFGGLPPPALAEATDELNASISAQGQEAADVAEEEAATQADATIETEPANTDTAAEVEAVSLHSRVDAQGLFYQQALHAIRLH